jgi:hypothetical protein
MSKYGNFRGKKKNSKSEDFGTIFPKKNPLFFVALDFFFVTLMPKIHLKNQIKQGAMSHCGLAIYIKKKVS